MIGTGSCSTAGLPPADDLPRRNQQDRRRRKGDSGVNDLKRHRDDTREVPALDGHLRWVINAEGGGRTGLVYNADPDGSNVASPPATSPARDR